jgi:hypothetical protein
MAKKRNRVTRILKQLTADEREELEYNGLDEEEIELMQKRLATNRWLFGSKSKRLRLELHYVEEVVLKSGKRLAAKENLSATFTPSKNASSELEKGRFETTDRRTAMLIYLADDFNDRFWDIGERGEVDFKKAYEKFKESVVGDEEKLRMLKEDLAIDAAKV